MERRASSSRRIANVLLSVVLVLGLMPAPAFAGETGIANDAADPAVTEAASLLTAIDTFPANDDASSESSEAEATPTPGWTQSGSCEWMIDNEGLLTVRPLGNGESGFLEDWGDYGNAPWYDYRSMIKSAVVKPGVSAWRCNTMFAGCSSLTTLDLSGFDTSKVVDMSWMFSGCSSLTTLDLSGFDTSGAGTMYCMFNNCSSLKTIRASKLFSTAGLDEPQEGMFSGCSSLVGGEGTAYDSSFVDSSRARIDGGANAPGYFTAESTFGATLTPGWTQSDTCEWMIDNEGLLTVRPLGNGESGFLEDWGDCGNVPWYNYRSMIKSAVVKPGVSARTCVGMFSGCSSLTTLDLSGFDTSQVTSTGSMFSYCTSLTSLDLSSFDTSKVTSMGNMFLFCSSLSFLNLSSFDTSAVTGMLGMFYGCTSLTSLDLSSFDTSKVTSMEYMFIACKSLASLDLSSFDTSKVTNMGYMFHGCKSLASLDLSSFDTSKVTGMYKMFLGCSSLTTLDLSSFNTAKVASMSEMFSGCSSLKTIFVSRLFTTAEVKSSNYMFDGCCLLVGGAGTAYDSSFVNAARARIDGGSNAPGYFIGKHEKLDGDVNGNGALNVVDAQIAYDIATTDFYKDRQDYADMRARADVTWDNEVDAADAFAIQYAVLRGW